MKLGLLIPQFPTQTHVAMWRVGDALRRLGHTVDLLSTRPPDGDPVGHQFLLEEARRTFYAWPPHGPAALATLLSSPLGTLRCLRYLAGLSEGGFSAKLKLLAAMLPAAAGLKRTCARRGTEHILVHSCADAAHLVALTRLLGGPGYSLRLGGDLDVYGHNHDAKMRDATLVIPAAQVNHREVRDRVGLPAERMLVSTLGVDVERFQPAAAPADPPPLRVVSVARLNRNKGHLDTLAAVRQAADAGVDLHFTLAGAGPEEEAIRAEVARLHLEDRVTLHGPADESQVIALLQAADVFVLASTGQGEASPVAVIEAMACGTVAVCSVVGGTADMIDDGRDGLLFPQHDVDALARHLIRLAGDADLRRQLGSAARAKAQAQWDCRAVAQRIIEKLQERLAADASPPVAAGPGEVRHAR
ncbi:MAG: glycosyltransferase [Planctomycetota bacterium]